MTVRPQTFLISGCASGIGKHMAVALATANAGHRVVMLDIDALSLERAAREHGLLDRPDVLVRTHDVRDAEGWEAVVSETIERFGSLDVMLNIAGYLKPGFVCDTAPEDLERHIDVNVKGVMLATRVGARQMLRQGRGHIVNLASIAGISHVPGLAAYCASKHAVRGFSLSVAHELAPRGVHVSVVCPDAVETPMLARQTSHPEAAMTFGGGRGLTLVEVESALMHVLTARPLELVLPIPGSARGALARLGNAFPALAKLGIDRVRKQGQRVQAARLHPKR